MQSVFHFSPPKGWLNDPNGLIRWRGQYHLFYQSNPLEARWCNIHWGHAVSSDLLRWEHLPPALAPSGWFDESGCWSGCAVADGDELKLIYTAARGYNPQSDTADIQIRMASSRDGIRFSKHPKVLLDWPWGTEIGWHKLCGFRDPSVWREGDCWKMIVGAGLEGRGGAALLFESPDLEQWQFVDLLAVGDFESAEPIWTGSVWECPQLLDLGKSHALMMSVWYQRKGYYTAYLMGDYAHNQLEVNTGEKLDYGDSFYAPQAFKDEQGNWVMMGWILDHRSEAQRLESGISGRLSLPRQLSMRSGRLWQEPVPLDLHRSPIALENLNHSAFQLDLSLEQGQTLSLADAHGDHWIELSLASRHWLMVTRSNGLAVYLPVEWDSQNWVALQLFWDCGLLEIFASGRAMSVQLNCERLSIQKPPLSPSIKAWALAEKTNPD